VCIISSVGPRGSVVDWGIMLQAGKSEFKPRWGWYFEVTNLFHPQYGPVVDSVSNRNEYQESFWGVEGARRVRLTNLTPICLENVRASTSHNLIWAFAACYSDSFTFWIFSVGKSIVTKRRNSLTGSCKWKSFHRRGNRTRRISVIHSKSLKPSNLTWNLIPGPSIIDLNVN
jgi:hypothetical protein